MAGHQHVIGRTCAKCGACAPLCPVYQSTGRESHTARGKLHLFAKDGSFDSNYFNDLLGKCLQCGACDTTCPRNLAPSATIRAWRARQPFGGDPHGFVKLISRKVLASPRLQEGGSRTVAALLRSLPAASGLRKRLDLLVPELLQHRQTPWPAVSGGTPLAYFPGCLADHLNTDIGAATAQLAGGLGYQLTAPQGQTCCGLASHACGSRSEARQLARKNMAAFATSSGPILTSCASCSSHLLSYPELFADDPQLRAEATSFGERIVEFSTFFAERLLPAACPAGPAVYYHDPCHLRFGPCQVTEAPRHLLRAATGNAPLDLPGQCCGQGGLFHLTNPTISQDIFGRLLDQITELSGPQVVTTCSGCLLQWQQGLARAESPLRAEHLAVFLAKIYRDC